jgi:hypothetical protein
MRLSKAITMATIILETITNRSVYKDVASLILTYNKFNKQKMPWDKNTNS